MSNFLKALAATILALTVLMTASPPVDAQTSPGFFPNPVQFKSTVTVGEKSTAAASAVLDVRSTTKGALFPRMTSTQRDAINSPATGLVIYNTTTQKLNWYDGDSWEEAGGAAFDYATLNALTAETTPTTSDLFLIGDAGSSTNKKITGGNFFNLVPSMSSLGTVAVDDVLPIYDTSGSASFKVEVDDLLAANSPKWSVFFNGTFNSGSGSWTEASMNSVSDSQNRNVTFASNRITPLQAGNYFMYFEAWKYDSTDTAVLGCRIGKNGSTISEQFAWEAQSGTKDSSVNCASIISVNGTTDYLSVFVYQDTGDTRTWEGTRTVFSGWRIW